LAAQEKWGDARELPNSRLDTILSIGIGGIISAAIIITAAAAFHGTGFKPANAGEMEVQLEPLLGSWAKWFFAIGLLSAGFLSAITAPLLLNIKTNY
jgi:manganese transport protein